MEITDDMESKSHTELEAWFVNSVSAETLPLDRLMRVLSSLAEKGRSDVAENWAELLQDALAERMDKTSTLGLLKLRCGWRGDDPAFRDVCVKTLHKVFKGQIGQGIVSSAGFDGNISPAECLRRLGVIASLQPGILCHDKTWGFGIVRSVDEFYKKVVIDFEKKPGHQMSFAYVAEVLEILGENHILAIKHRDPQGFAKLLSDDPAELIRMALRSFGPLNVIQIRELFTGRIVPESEWKGFWDAARKNLKADPRIKMPSGREDPIRMLASATDHHDELFESLVAERDPQTILDLIQELECKHGKGGLPDNVLQACVERLAHSLKGVRGRGHSLAAVAAIVARRIGVASRLDEMPAVIEGMYTPDTFLTATSGMPAREVPGLIELMSDHDKERTIQLLLSLLSRMQMNVLNEAMEFLVASGKEKECADYFRVAVRAEQASLEVLFWLCRHTDEAEAWAVGNLSEILIRAVNSLELNRMGKALQTQKQLRAIFDQRPWMEKVLGRMDNRQRENLLSKVNVSSGWDAVEKRAVMAIMIKLYPELSRVLSSANGQAEEPAARARFTAWRSFNRRREQLRKLIEEDVPQNSREIAIARSYGDLRENAEYKAAKEHQGILLSRQEEYETGLREVQGTDFSGFTTEAAGVGTSVVIADEQGRTERYNILGEWDGDEELGIISCTSAMARALEGRKAGEDVTLPAVAGETKAKIVEITGLPEAVRKWIAG